MSALDKLNNQELTDEIWALIHFRDNLIKSIESGEDITIDSMSAKVIMKYFRADLYERIHLLDMEIQQKENELMNK